MAVAGGGLEAGVGRHAERETELTGREGEDGEGRVDLSLCQVAAADSGHPLCRGSVLRHQRCTSPSAAMRHLFSSHLVRLIWLNGFSSSQLYFYAFDIFRESGVPEDQRHYLAIGIGATELIAITLCVSTSVVYHENHTENKHNSKTTQKRRKVLKRERNSTIEQEQANK